MVYVCGRAEEVVETAAEDVGMGINEKKSEVILQKDDEDVNVRLWSRAVKLQCRQRLAPQKWAAAGGSAVQS